VVAAVEAAPETPRGAAHEQRAPVVADRECGRPSRKVSKLRPPSRVRFTTSDAPTGTRCWSATPGTNQAVSPSAGCTPTVKPKFDRGAAVTSCHVAPASVERQMPLWCWHQSLWGCAAQRTIRCGSCTFSFSACSGGMNVARMPLALRSQCAPPSRVIQAPPQLMPSRISPGRCGCAQIEWMPGTS
jgi:hypothetical protein